jgi:DNA-binding transcriptional MocR family regulator
MLRDEKKQGAARAEGWMPTLPDHPAGPIYRIIADLIAADIAAGKLRGGERLPPHRRLAERLGLDLTTVTRAYREAQRRGLVEAVVGRGTFVRGAAGAAGGLRREAAAPAIDTGMNLPPQPEAAAIPRRVSEGLAALHRHRDLAALLTYRESAGGEEERAAGAAWLRPLLPAARPEHLLVTAGAQAALLALVTTYVAAGEVVLTEALTYPGFRALAAQLGIALEGVAIDGEGLIPTALEAACRTRRCKALYCVPTQHNPTTATMSRERRQAIATILRRYDVLLFEDDAYGLLPATPLPPLASLAPERAFYVGSLAKTLLPGLRIAYLVVPGAREAMRLGAALRATTLMASPLMAALAARWIEDGTAAAILAAIRGESALRQRLARDLLPAGSFIAHPEGHHLWLTLPPHWSGAEFAAQARQLGLAAVPGSVFAVAGGAAPPAVRIALGAAADCDRLGEAMRLAGDALQQHPAVLSKAF